MYGRWDGSDCVGQHVVEDALEEMTAGLGLESYLFVFQEFGERATLRVSVIDGSAGEFAREYIGRRWFSIDPLLARARQLVTPFWGWQSVTLETRGQMELREVASEEGFRTVAVVPALSPWNGVTGALYFGSSQVIDPPPNFTHRHTELRTMAIDVMTWAVRNSYRRELGGDFHLKALERAALRCELMGYTTADTANLLDLPQQKVEYLFRCTQQRMNAPNKKEAARRAAMAGVLTL
jgi:hypothetical protein